MTNKLYTYALVKALYDQNQDYFDTFLPLVLSVISETSYTDTTKIQHKLEEKYVLKIPLHILKTICNRGKLKNFLIQRDNYREYQLTSVGVEYLGKQEQEQDVERRINSLVEDISKFFENKGVVINTRETKELLNNFLSNNLEGLVDFINPQIETEGTVSVSRGYSVILIEYIKEAQKNKPDEYKELKEMIYGSIISSVLSSKDSSEITSLGNRGFKKSLVFLDSNLIFSILGFHSPERNQSSLELLELLNKTGFKLQVFDFTLDEICRVINGYLQNKNKYPLGFDIDSIYSVLKKKGWNSSDVAEFINNIEETIEAKGVDVYITDGINLTDYSSPSNENLRSKISSNKIHDIRGLSTNHDLAAIDAIREIRKHSVRKIEDVEAFFLTSDYVLQKIVLSGMNHNENGTVSEVILDRALANILWLKNPTTDVPLDIIIATHSRNLFIDRKIWDRFYSILEKLKKDGKVNDSQIEILLYRNTINNLLKEYSGSDVNKVTEKLTLDAIEEAIQLSEKEKGEMLSDRHSVEIELFTAQSEKEKEEQAHNSKIISIKSKLRQKASSISNTISNTISILSIGLLWITEYYIFLWLDGKLPTQHLTMITIFYSGIGITIVGCTVVLCWKSLREALRESFLKYFLKKYYTELDLEV